MKPAQAFVNFFAQAAGAALVLTALYFAETRFWPVVQDFEITRIEKSERGFVFYGELNKARPCEFVGMTVYGITPDGKRGAIVQFRNDLFGANVGSGQQSWGPVVVPVIDTRYRWADIQATHRCHPLWLQTTNYATLDLSRIPR